MPFYDLMPLADAIEPVFVQEDPSTRSDAAAHFFYSHRVR